MQIKLNGHTLCAGLTRNSTGSPIGPSNYTSSESPGIIKHEFIGADRIAPEHIRCNSGTISFDVERIFPSVDEALAYATKGFREEPVDGELTFDDEVVFAKAAVTARHVTHVGCAVAVSYTIEG